MDKRQIIHQSPAVGINSLHYRVLAYLLLKLYSFNKVQCCYYSLEKKQLIPRIIHPETATQ